MENNSNEQKLTIDQLKAMKPIEVLENKIVRDRFIALYNRIHDSENGELFFEQEKYIGS